LKLNTKLNLKHILFFTILFLSILSWSQPVLKRTVNSTLYNYSNSHPHWNQNSKLNKWGRLDTLKIPFFDDFVSTKIYPDSSRWFNNMVFINNDFPINPPSFGVATFDNLNAKGQPQFELNGLQYGPCDTLLSLPINLKDSGTRFYGIKDSFYFSFYYQRQGNGDASDSRDSFLVQFKDTAGRFITQWRVKGGALTPFTFVMIPIKSNAFFHKSFQFRFINFARHTGNLNQWHLDYVHLARNRRKNITSYNDFAIQSRPTSLLKNYFQMPYNHFISDMGNQKADSIFFYANNLNNTTLNIEARHVETNNGNVLVSTNFANNAANVLADSNAKRRFVSYNLNGLTGSPVVIKREYELRESGISSKYAPNDKMTVYQEFNSCYAYDDGTAEYGFGYDDDVVDPFYKGAIAYKFNLAKSDSLWAIGIFFNRSEKSTSALKFDLKVWQKITATGQGRGGDESLLTIAGLSPSFTDSINGFHVFYIDTPIILPKGDFFIGWEQLGNNNLDVGWDVNDGYHEADSRSNIFFSDRGNWTAYGKSGLKGALMMRPYVGKKRILGPAGISKSEQKNVQCFPNPFTDKIEINTKEEIISVELYDLSGKKVAESDALSIDTSLTLPGIYVLKALAKNGEIYHQKVLKLQ